MPEAPAGMVEHGIMSTQADYWVHLFPYSYEVFWYRVHHCRSYIERKNPPMLPGKSADGTATGNGYLIPNNAYFVRNAEVPPQYLAHTDWRSLTDREFGFLGEEITDVLVEHNVIKFPASRPLPLRTIAEQFSARDLQIQWLHPLTAEVKTERHSGTGNLYVQTHEGGHRVHQLREFGGNVERFTRAPELSDEIPF